MVEIYLFGGKLNWDVIDFVAMGVLLFGLGSMFVLIAKTVEKKYRIFAAIGVLVVFFWLWVELAVGVFTNWGS